MTTPDGTVFFLPGLGFDAAAAAPFADALSTLSGGHLRVVGIDLPGHGGSPDAPDGSVSALADRAIELIEAESDGGPFFLAAHSMGGKVAAVVAHRILNGHANVFGLAGAVLLAPSPPTPEPMADDKRAQMLSWADHGPLSEAHARAFVAQNVAGPLGEAAARDAVAQVRRMSPLAWRRWLTEGSMEDVTDAVGVIDLPVVVLAGEDDDDLGASAQPQLLADLYPRARVVALPDTGHLLPYERASEVATEIVQLWDATVSATPQVTAEWGRLIASDRTAAEARSLLARRAIADDVNYAPRALSPQQLGMLRSLADRLLPQPGERRIDLAARIDADLAQGRGDGWRSAGLPDDASAYRLGLDDLASIWPDYDEAEQDALIEGIISGELCAHELRAHELRADGHPAGAEWNARMREHWFDDVRSDLTRAWLAHPASLARVGYDGFATSGAGSGAGQVGYVALAAGVRDPWEPAGLGDLATADDEAASATDSDIDDSEESAA